MAYIPPPPSVHGVGERPVFPLCLEVFHLAGSLSASVKSGTSSATDGDMSVNPALNRYMDGEMADTSSAHSPYAGPIINAEQTIRGALLSGTSLIQIGFSSGVESSGNTFAAPDGFGFGWE